MDSRKLDESGVNGIFDMFDDLKDKIKLIEVGVGGLLKAFLTHKCFEPIVEHPVALGGSPLKRDAHGTLRGILFDARVFFNPDLPTGRIRAYGQESKEPPHNGQTTTKHCFELTYRTKGGKGMNAG